MSAGADSATSERVGHAAVVRPYVAEDEQVASGKCLWRVNRFGKYILLHAQTTQDSRCATSHRAPALLQGVAPEDAMWKDRVIVVGKLSDGAVHHDIADLSIGLAPYFNHAHRQRHARLSQRPPRLQEQLTHVGQCL